jgi:hypothetical protein
MRGFGISGKDFKNQSLSNDLERVMGIEPTLVAWEATVLPLNYTRDRQTRGRRHRPFRGSEMVHPPPELDNHRPAGGP